MSKSSKEPVVPAPGAARSFWLQEALTADPGASCPRLRGRIKADVCIVGAGYAGLWTAMELSRREPGLNIVLLEADICGAGGSGRNAGFISPLWYDLPSICKTFGVEGGLRIARAMAAQTPEIGDFCRENGIDTWYHYDGGMVVFPEWQNGSFRDYQDAIALMTEHGDGERMVAIDADRVREYVDCPVAARGVLIPETATVQPGRLARGLRRIALERGVRVFEETPVKRIEKQRPAHVIAPVGSVEAQEVVLTIGAWGLGWPGYRNYMAGMAEYVLATEPIPDGLREIGWKTHIGLSDSRNEFFYLRKTDDDRIVIGGGGGNAIFGGRIGRAVTHDHRLAERSAAGLTWLFPQLEGVRFEYAWGGPMEVTAAQIMFLQTLDPGNIHVGIGLSGHGLAATRVAGKGLTSLALHVEDEWSTLPVVGPPLAHVPPEPLRWPIVKTLFWAMESADGAAERDGRPRRMRQSIGSVPWMYRERLRAPSARAK